MTFYAICSDGDYFTGHEADSLEAALFAHVPDGGCPEPTDSPTRDTHGWWHKGVIAAYTIHSPDLQRILVEGDIADLRCPGEGDFAEPRDFAEVGRFRWNHEP